MDTIDSLTYINKIDDLSKSLLLYLWHYVKKYDPEIFFKLIVNTTEKLLVKLTIRPLLQVHFNNMLATVFSTTILETSDLSDDGSFRQNLQRPMDIGFKMA